MFNPGIEVIAKQKKIIGRFQTANATTPERAIDPFILGLKNNRIFRKLVSRRILVEVSSSLFYLDELRAKVYRVTRRRIAFGIMIVLLVAFTVFCIIAW